MFWNCYIVTRFLKKKKKEKKSQIFFNVDITEDSELQKPLFKLLFSHRNVPISKRQLSKYWKSDEQQVSLELKKKGFSDKYY